MERVSIIINGQEVVGEGNRSQRDIGVSITQPYLLSDGVHIPYFGMAFYRDNLGFMGENGDRRMEGILRELHDLASFIKTNYEALEKALDAARIRGGQPLGIDEKTFDHRKKALRRRLKQGEIDNKEHQRLRGLLRKERYARDAWISATYDAFFDDNFPETLSHRTRAQILAIFGHTF